MRLNRYTRVIEINDNEYALYNTINGALIRLEKDYMENNNTIKLEKFNQDELDTLSKFEFINTSAEHILNQLISNYQNDSKALVITIELTRKCNLYCTYCYENGLKNNNTISREILDQIIKYVDCVTEKKEVKFLKLNFIGGEPLLAKEQLLYVYNKLLKLCKNKKIFMASLLNTNGVLLEKEFLKQFENMDISITLSNRADHDKMRPFINGKSSYDLIIDKIQSCREIFEREDINLCIRYNTNGENYKEFPIFLTELNKLNVNIKQVEPMYTDEYEQNSFVNTLSKKEFIKWNSTTAIDALIENGFKLYYAPQSILAPCKAYIKDNCKIYADGNLGLCDASEYNSRGPHISEVINNDNYLNEYFKEIKMWTPFSDNKCRTCSDLVLCGGSYFCRTSKCNYKRYDLDNFIKKFIHYEEKGKSQLFVGFNEKIG